MNEELLSPCRACGQMISKNLTTRSIPSSGYNSAYRVIGGVDSVYQIYRRLRWSRYIAWIYVLPGIHRICKIAYFIIAKNRSRLSQTKCESDVCNID